MTNRLTIDEYCMALAYTARSRSEDQHFKVGACVIREDRTIAGLGYNGAPPKVEVDWTDRDGRRGMVVHAEVNALRYIRPGEATTLYSTAMPCDWCLRMIASYGITRVVYREAIDPTTYDVDKIFALAAKCNIVVDHVGDSFPVEVNYELL